MENSINYKNKISGKIISFFLIFVLVFGVSFTSMGMISKSSAATGNSSVQTVKSVQPIHRSVKKMKAKKPKITGTVQVGKTLKVKRTNWAPKAKYSYQWQRNGKKIKKATKTKYKLTKADQGKKISVKVTAKRAGYFTASKTSSKTKKVKAAPKKMKVATPKISGTLQVGKTLTAKKTNWASGAKYSYQWQRNGKNIKKATKSKYKLTKADQGKKISVKITAKRSGYYTASKTSSKTKAIARAPKNFTIYPTTCSDSYSNQKCVDSKDFSYIDYSQWKGPKWVGGHQKGKAKVILDFRVGDTITVKGTKAAGKYRVTSYKNVAWKKNLEPSVFGKGTVFQTCTTKNGSTLRVVYTKKI